MMITLGSIGDWRVQELEEKGVSEFTDNYFVV